MMTWCRKAPDGVGNQSHVWFKRETATATGGAREQAGAFLRSNPTIGRNESEQKQEWVEWFPPVPPLPLSIHLSQIDRHTCYWQKNNVLHLWCCCSYSIWLPIKGAHASNSSDVWRRLCTEYSILLSLHSSQRCCEKWKPPPVFTESVWIGN